MMRTRLDQIEARLQALVESSATFLAGPDPQHRLAHQLVEAVQQNMTLMEDGRIMAPGEYQISLPLALEAYQKDPTALLTTLARSLQETAREYGIFFVNEPNLHFTLATEAMGDEIRVSAVVAPPAPVLNREQTALNLSEEGAPGKRALPRNAFLIVNGAQTFPLDRAVINIGRRSNNTLALADPRVSRTHAQIRAVKGQYILFDLNSSGGTMVNGQRIHQYILRPGDVISLSGVQLIYGEDAPLGSRTDDDLGTTRTLNTPPPPEIIE